VYRYPIAFSVLFLPLSITRFIYFTHGISHVSSLATLSAATIYDLCGLVEVVIFFKIRRGLLLFGDSESESIPTIVLLDDEVKPLE
jgi:hypothetical protein